LYQRNAPQLRTALKEFFATIERERLNRTLDTATGYRIEVVDYKRLFYFTNKAPHFYIASPSRIATRCALLFG
jgi:hypothetical protein